ncbi:MAG: mandelate racemase/muconate lactonizing enzyme family protein [Chloroflexi bacterium]|nr:mandelate racemase/muconate lactonizing enzyme family protein [Chloroflexota bacterium]
MRITEVTAELYRVRRQRPIRNGLYTYTESGTVLVRVRTDAGLEGIGWSGGEAGPDTVVLAAARALGQHAIGLDVFDAEQLWERMYQPKLFGRRGLTVRAMAAIDIALWDAAGKTVGVPLYKLLGGYRSRVPAYLAGGYYLEGKGLDELAQEMRDKVAAGARYVKMKVGGAPMREDVERVRIVREAIGQDVRLMIDANNAYAPLEAIRMARLVADYDIYWFEEPVHAEDYEGLANVRAHSAIPIATGENEYTRYGFRDLIACRGADILQPDANVLGGITEFRHIASLASAHNLPIAPHGSALLHVHLVAAFANGLIVEHVVTEGERRRGMFTTALRLDAEGMVSPPDAPGLGIALDEEYLRAHRVE